MKLELFQEMGLAPKPTGTWKTNVMLAYTYQPVPEQVSSLLAREKHPLEDNHDTTTDQSNKRRKLILKDGRDVNETFLNKERELEEILRQKKAQFCKTESVHEINEKYAMYRSGS